MFVYQGSGATVDSPPVAPSAATGSSGGGGAAGGEQLQQLSEEDREILSELGQLLASGGISQVQQLMLVQSVTHAAAHV